MKTKRAIAVVLVAAAAATAVLVLWPMDPRPYLDVKESGEIEDCQGRLLHAFLNGDDQWCFPRPLDAISPYLIHATLAAEDARFYVHPGMDPVSVARAVAQNVRGRAVVSGASTLTMQVAKRGRVNSMAEKIAQAVRALRIERRANKDAILEAYLNRAPYGLNLVGCEAASRRYFGKTAGELTLAEAALLAGLPKSPTRLMPLDHAERAVARRGYVLTRMLDEGYITNADYEDAMRQPAGVAWHDLPALAPHLAMTLRDHLDRTSRIETTLEGPLQAAAEGIVTRELKRFDGAITNGAAIIADAEQGTVLARVGSADFWSTPGGGQVDACRALRSPGSALKPFTYALAMERQQLYACEKLLDDTLDYGLYNPGNYDDEYRGLISADEALRRSLNVPAITVLDRIGVRPIHNLLCAAGLTTISNVPQQYGLGLTLGNCAVRLDELTAAYVMLAREGMYRPLRCIRSEAPGQDVRLLSRGVCVALFDMLEQTLPKELGRGLISATGRTRRVCWKTGTSTGHHDAWAFVFNRQYVVGVWLGNNSGRPSNRLVGLQSALPMAADLFRLTTPTSKPEWPGIGDDLRPVEVCSITGLPASEWCTHRKIEWLPTAQYIHRRCDVHRPGQVGECWPSTAKGWDLARVACRVDSEPVALGRHDQLRILAPAQGAEFVLTGQPGGDCVRVRASTDAQQDLHWYLDDRYLGRSDPDGPLMLELEPGEHRLACLGSSGALDKVTFTVTRPAGPVAFKDM
ncbi:MAG TPA: penicillin-binding protein 1C [Candidatus Hydrogenedentes bacterium]|nr:penicillin-binding protein 1C [Candidatus Hydrogenedentota bacterium]HPG67658.1 penicillin-binding protein 1C [Candidatus Hydrogenedentota bacterium]